MIERTQYSLLKVSKGESEESYYKERGVWFLGYTSFIGPPRYLGHLGDTRFGLGLKKDNQPEVFGVRFFDLIPSYWSGNRKTDK